MQTQQSTKKFGRGDQHILYIKTLNYDLTQSIGKVGIESSSETVFFRVDAMKMSKIERVKTNFGQNWKNKFSANCSNKLKHSDEHTGL